MATKTRASTRKTAKAQSPQPGEGFAFFWWASKFKHKAGWGCPGCRYDWTEGAR